jgi:cation:H+ antiporter
MLDFSAFPLPINLAAFAAAAVVVWFAGTHLARYADAIAEITGLGSAVIGMGIYFSGVGMLYSLR